MIGDLFLEVGDFEKKSIRRRGSHCEKKGRRHSRWRLPVGGLLGEFGDDVYLIWPAES